MVGLDTFGSRDWISAMTNLAVLCSDMGFRIRVALEDIDPLNKVSF